MIYSMRRLNKSYFLFTIVILSFFFFVNKQHSIAAPSLPNQLYSNASPWNTPIGSNVQLDPNSATMISAISSCCHVPAMFTYGMPIYISSPTDPSYTIKTGDATFNSYNPINIPEVAAPSPGSDKWLFIFDPRRNVIFEMWSTVKNGNTWTANTGNVFSVTGDGVLQPNGTQTSGNGASYLGGVIRQSEIQRGNINHALSLATSHTSHQWRYPMHTSDGNGTSTSDIPEGARLQLDPTVNCDGLPGASTGEKLVCKALQIYGGYVHDTGGVQLSAYFEGEDLSDPNRNPPNGSPGDPGRPGGIFDQVGLHDGQDMSHIPWNKLRVLKAWNSFASVNITPPQPTNGPPVAHVTNPSLTPPAWAVCIFTAREERKRMS